MRILLLNSILYTPRTTPHGRIIPPVDSIEDCMIVKLGIEFARQGHEVTLVAAEDYKPLRQQSFPIRILYLPSALPRLFLPTLLPLHPRLVSFLRKNRKEFDLVISSEVFSFNSLFAACLAHDKTIVWQEGGKHNRKFFRLPSLLWYHVVARIFMRRVKVIPRSPIAGAFIRKFGLQVSPRFIDHGVDGNVFGPAREKSRSFVVVAHLDKDKNVMSIIGLFRKFMERYPEEPHLLYVIGEGEEGDRLKEYVCKHQLDKLVRFLGRIPQKELAGYLNSAVCLLCNSANEMNMISIGEAIVAGTPVITNTVPYSHEWVGQHGLGIVKDDWTEEDMHEIVTHNSRYVENCLRYAPQLLLSGIPDRFIEQFNRKKP